MADRKEPFEPFNINLATAGRFGGAGLAIGASAASAALILKMLMDAIAKKRERSENANRRTITLVLPDKNAEAAPSTAVGEDKKIKTKNDKPETKVRDAITGKNKQIRRADGKYDIKSANWQTMVASLLALAGGTGAGYALVNKVYDMKRKKELEEQLELMKQEYLDKLMSTSKNAMSKDAGLLRRDERRGSPSFSAMDYPPGLAMLALLLGSGSVAYVTKQLMDEYNKEPESSFQPKELPTIERIVFRSEEPGDENIKTGSASDPIAADCALAAIGIYTDLMSGKANVLGDVKCAEAVRKAGTDYEQLYKMASEDYDRLMMYLKTNPELRTTIKRLAIEKHPIMKYFKWAVDLPLIGKITDDKLYTAVSDRYGPMSDVYDALRRGESAERIATKIGSVKEAGVAGMMGAYMGGTMGGTLASALLEREKTKDPAQSVKEINESPEQKSRKLEDLVDKIELAAKDRRSAMFLAENSDKIRAMLKILAAEGKL